jgi:Tetratricopeptide repeat
MAVMAEMKISIGRLALTVCRNNLGNLYTDQGEMEKAAQMYLRALQGYEKSMGLDHSRTRVITRNLYSLRVKIRAGEQSMR